MSQSDYLLSIPKMPSELQQKLDQSDYVWFICVVLHNMDSIDVPL